jgi:hypothetical protein
MYFSQGQNYQFMRRPSWPEGQYLAWRPGGVLDSFFWKMCSYTYVSDVPWHGTQDEKEAWDWEGSNSVRVFPGNVFRALWSSQP